MDIIRPTRYNVNSLFDDLNQGPEEPTGTMVIGTTELTLLAVVSGMLGLGVAFSAIPFLGGPTTARSASCKVCLLARKFQERVKWSLQSLDLEGLSFDSFIDDMEDDRWDCAITSPY